MNAAPARACRRWAQLDAVFEHGFAYARSGEFYGKTLFWQWMRLPGDVLFALAAVLMTWDFLRKIGPVLGWAAKEGGPGTHPIS